VAAGSPFGQEGGQWVDILQSSFISIATRGQALLFPSQYSAKLLNTISTCVLPRQRPAFLETTHSVDISISLCVYISINQLFGSVFKFCCY